MRFPPFNPYIAVIIGIIAFSVSAILVKLASGVPAAIIANYRLLFAALIMAPYVIIKHRHQFKTIKRNDWILSAVSAAFLALHFILWFESLNYTSVTSSVVLVTLQPIFVFIGTYLLFQERFSSGVIISVAITLFGSAIISWGDYQLNQLALIGDLLAIGGAIAVTAYFLCGHQLRRSLSLSTYMFIVYSMSSFMLIIYNLFLNNSFTGYSSTQWLIFLALAIFPTFFGHFLFNWALKWLNTSTISLAIIFEPIGATILAYFILGESVTDFQWLGGTIVIFGFFLFVMSTTRKRKVTISTNQK